MTSYVLYDVIRRPVITEKSTIMSEYRKYVFEVAGFANKTMIKKAVEEIFRVKVDKVNVLNVKGKKKRFKGIVGWRSGYKKAMVTLQDNQNIDFAAGVK
jgi:large subunit ribosomal protein L23